MVEQSKICRRMSQIERLLHGKHYYMLVLAVLIIPRCIIGGGGYYGAIDE
jgi:hypothetical protein